jgi:hypothetical protein
MVPAAPFPPVSAPDSWVEAHAAVPAPVVVVVAGRLVVAPGPPVVVVAGCRVDVVVVGDEGPDEQAAARTAITSTPAAAIRRGVPPVIERSVGMSTIP